FSCLDTPESGTTYFLHPPVPRLVTKLSPSSFILMLPLPPKTTLFPTRRSSDLHHVRRHPARQRPQGAGRRGHPQVAGKPRRPARSEEHTSELQSRRDLVCRLLLEKKKKSCRR